jgi:hypothetical protein
MKGKIQHGSTENIKLLFSRKAAKPAKNFQSKTRRLQTVTVSQTGLVSHFILSRSGVKSTGALLCAWFVLVKYFL